MKPAKQPSNRSFGSLFTVVFALWGAVSWWRSRPTAPYLLAIAIGFALITLLHSDWLAPLNRAWMRLAEILNRVVSPIVLGLLYYGLVTPFGAIMRLLGRDPMRRGFEAQASSYWIPRQPPGPPPDSLSNQF
jgi:hypothetical protein